MVKEKLYKMVASNRRRNQEDGCYIKAKKCMDIIYESNTRISHFFGSGKCAECKHIAVAGSFFPGKTEYTCSLCRGVISFPDRIHYCIGYARNGL